jgi:hypothetical protein
MQILSWCPPISSRPEERKLIQLMLATLKVSTHLTSNVHNLRLIAILVPYKWILPRLACGPILQQYASVWKCPSKYTSHTNHHQSHSEENKRRMNNLKETQQSNHTHSHREVVRPISQVISATQRLDLGAQMHLQMLKEVVILMRTEWNQHSYAAREGRVHKRFRPSRNQSGFRQGCDHLPNVETSHCIRLRRREECLKVVNYLRG